MAVAMTYDVSPRSVSKTIRRQVERISLPFISSSASSSSSRSPAASTSRTSPTQAPQQCPRPIPNSYWATPYLVACEFPYCPLTPTQIARKQTKQKLDALLLAGVRTFIDLTEPHELFPYYPHLSARCALLGIDSREVEYHNFPIVDRNVPSSVEFVREIMDVLRTNEKRGRVCAVHCRGGIGRTGLVVGCWLVECGIARDGDEALRIIDREWQGVEKRNRYPCSPETVPQVEFVRTFTRSHKALLKSATLAPALALVSVPAPAPA